MSASPTVRRTTRAAPRPLHETEMKLLEAACDGVPRAREELVNAFMPLIGRVARIYSHVPAVDRSELMQEGVVGMLRALDRYDRRLGTPFWAYASWWVRQAMQQLVSELSRPLVLSDRALRQLARIREARRSFASERSREPTLAELAEACELSTAQLQRLLLAERQPRSLEEPLEGAGGGSTTVGDMLCDPRGEDAYDELATRLLAAEVPHLLECLSERERVVIRSRYGLQCAECTLGELGRSIGVSAERVRQIEQTALEKMRAPGAREAHRPTHALRRRGPAPPQRRHSELSPVRAA
jgi:RNA polymerase primary sigma factor